MHDEGTEALGLPVPARSRDCAQAFLLVWWFPLYHWPDVRGLFYWCHPDPTADVVRGRGTTLKSGNKVWRWFLSTSFLTWGGRGGWSPLEWEVSSERTGKQDSDSLPPGIKLSVQYGEKSQAELVLVAKA